MASPNLVINILANADEAMKALKQTESATGDLGKSTSSMGKIIAGGAAAGAAALVALGVDAFNAAAESQKIARETERVLRTTGSAAWISAGQVAELAGALSDKSGADDEAIQSGANLLLTFTRVTNEVGQGNDVFDRATAAALDMSTAMGSDMSGASIQLGKALNDPIKGITALAKAGVSFSEDQKAQIKLMQESGDLLGAQKVILAEVEKEFKGAAEAAGTPMDKLKVAIGNLQETIGANLIPPVMAAAEAFTDLLGPAVEVTTDFLVEHSDALKILAIVGLGTVAAAMVPVIAGYAAMAASAVIQQVLNLTSALGYMRNAFVTVAASQGVMEASSQAMQYALSSTAVKFGLIATAVSAFTDVSEDGVEAANRYGASLGDSTGDLDAMGESTKQLLEHTRGLVKQQEEQKTLGSQLGGIWDALPFTEVTNSMHDMDDEIERNTELHAAMEAKTAATTEAMAKLASGLVDATVEATGMSAASGDIRKKLEEIAKSEKIDITSAEGLDKLKALYDRTLVAKDSTLGMTEAQEKFNDAAATAKDKVDAYKQSLDALTGAHMNAAAAETNFSENSVSLLKTLVKNRDIANGVTDQAQAKTLAQTVAVNENNSAIQANAKLAMDLANATYAESGSVELATGKLMEHRNQLINVMIQMGYTRAEAEKYVDRLGLTPANINTQVHLDTAQAKNALGEVGVGYKEVEKGAVGKITLVLDKKALQGLDLDENRHGGAIRGAPAALVPVAGTRAAAPVPAPVFNLTINHTGLGVDSPRLQRDVVGLLTRWTQREGSLRVPVAP